MLLRIHPPRNLAPDHLEMVLVNPRLHLVLWALVPIFSRVLVPGPQPGQNLLLGACASLTSSLVSFVA